jgi:hypothetical protein
VLKPTHLPALKNRNAGKYFLDFRYQEDACPEGMLDREVVRAQIARSEERRNDGQDDGQDESPENF